MRAWIPLTCLGVSACFAPTDQTGSGSTDDSSGTGSSSMTTAPTSTASTTTASSTDPSETETDPTLTTSPSTTDPDTGSSESGPIPPFECVESILDPDLGANLVQIATQSEGDDFGGTCGGDGSPDAAYEWRVPFDGFFILDTEGSDFDTVLYALDGACDGPEIACNDNAPDVGYSQVIAPFVADQRVVVVLDGVAGESGTAQLNISAVECPSADVSGQALPQTFSNVAGTNTHGGDCGGDGNPERAFRWTAPNDGLFSFLATSDDFVPAVYLEQGPICGGLELGCNGDAPTSRGQVVRQLLAGEFVTIFVDSQGGTGNFDLDIVELDDACPGAPLPDPGPFGATIDDYADHMTSSCGADGYEESGNYNPYPDATFSWTSPGKIGASSGCNIIVTSGFPAAISMQEGSCDGPEVQCVITEFDGNMSYEGQVSVGHVPPTDFTISISPIQPSFSGWVTHDFSVQIECFAIA